MPNDKPRLRIKRGGKWGFDIPYGLRKSGGLGVSYQHKLALKKWCRLRNIKEGRV